VILHKYAVTAMRGPRILQMYRAVDACFWAARWRWRERDANQSVVPGSGTFSYNLSCRPSLRISNGRW